jgi:dipeptidyl aminopeptidase/acylaminoacyl peptidase
MVMEARYLAARLAAALMATSTPPASAVPDAPLAIEDVLNAPALAPYSEPVFSPDGRYLVYVVTENARNTRSSDPEKLTSTGLAWYGVAGDIWITDLQSGVARNLTKGGNNWAPAFSPDGRTLAFLGDRSGGGELGPARLWTADVARGDLRPASGADVRDGFTGLQWTADGRSVLVSLFPADLGRAGYAARMAGTEPVKANTPSEVTAKLFTFDPSRADAVTATDQINLDLWRRDVALIDVRSGAVRQLVEGSRVGHYLLSPDRKSLAYTKLVRAEKPGAGQYLYDLIVEDLDSGTPRTVASGIRLGLLARSFSWSPDGHSIAWRTDGPLAPDALNIVSVVAGAPREIASQPWSNSARIDSDPPAWDRSGRNLYFIHDDVLWRAAANGAGAASLGNPGKRRLELLTTDDHVMVGENSTSAGLVTTLDRTTKRSGFARAPTQGGDLVQFIDEDKRYGGYGTLPGVSKDGSMLAYVAEDARHPPDIFLLTATGTLPRKLTQVAPAISDRRLGSGQVIEWRSIDGKVEHGALIYPGNYVHGTRYPLIVKIYGGSSISDDLNRFGFASAPYENLQLFATRGYALLLADSDVNVATPMTDLMKSVIPGIDKAIELGVADPDRIGVTGHSYGGYSALSLIAQSPRFKAAVMRAGMGDMIASYGSLLDDGTNPGVSWSESGQGRMGGSLWEYRERYIENSPIFYLDRVKTPLLIIHGSKDDAVPVPLADEVFTDLRRLGKRVDYARYGGEGHWEGAWARANQIDALVRTIRWFDQYLSGNPTPSHLN